MLKTRPSSKPTFFATAADFRRWLDAHASTASELVVGFYKTSSGRASLRWSESVDEALCHGWIDGVRKRIDDESYLIRFTPRRPGSIWSAINIAKMHKLTDEGRMRPAGRRVFDQRDLRKAAIYASERTTPPELTSQELRAFRRNRAAWQFFEVSPPSYRKVCLHWVVSAKRPETRNRRLAKLVAACAEGVRL